MSNATVRARRRRRAKRADTQAAYDAELIAFVDRRPGYFLGCFSYYALVGRLRALRRF